MEYAHDQERYAFEGENNLYVGGLPASDWTRGMSEGFEQGFDAGWRRAVEFYVNKEEK